MRERVREQLICYIFIAALFLAGMCVEIPSADISFLRANEASMTDATGSVISNVAKITALERACTISMLRRDATTFLSSNRNRSLMKRNAGNVAALIAAETLLFYIFCLGKIAEWSSGVLRRSHATIVRYIQQTDGKK